MLPQSLAVTACAIALLLGINPTPKAAIAQNSTQVPIDRIHLGAFTPHRDAYMGAEFIVPNWNTTNPAYGGQLRLYDVHLAKMFEITDYECQNARLQGISWNYFAGGGEVNMGNFEISCRLAAQQVREYGTGTPEQTAIFRYSQPQRTEYIPILDITGNKVSPWMNFVRGFRPQ
jgi:serine/threonine-protein kinase